MMHGQQNIKFTKQSQGTYASVGTAGSYFANKICQAISERNTQLQGVNTQ
jgi:hypothetical protein